MANQEQGKLWNGHAGAAWVEAQVSLDRLFQPFEDRLVEAVTTANASQVLDVGCGAGATTLAIARRLGSRGRCTGVDLSQPMIELARRRAEGERSNARFVLADAQTQAFEPASFDMVVSRFGVMFFEDPVQAFANLHRAARPGSPLRCQVFRSAADNPFMTAAERAAAPLLPDLPPRRLAGPGQFAFADARQTQRLLVEAGWHEVQLSAIDVDCVMPASELESYLARMGPVGLALLGADPALQLRVKAAVRAAFAPFVRGDEVRFIAACWDLRARA